MKSARSTMRRMLRSLPKSWRAVLHRYTPGTLRDSLKRAIGLPIPLAFQQKYGGLDARWRLVSPHLPAPRAWLLDVGSNLGDTAARAAALGHVVIGIETRRSLVLRSARAAPPRVAFMVGEVDADFFRTMPAFSVVFFFSVLHRIWALQGRRSAEECLVSCLDKTHSILVEGAIRHERYMDRGERPPEFESNNLDEAVEWHLRWFRELMRDSGWRATCLGSVPATASEPRRPVFLLTSPDYRPRKIS